MKKLILPLFLAYGAASASVLGDLAAQMKGGTWVQVPQTNIGAVMGGGSHTGNLAPFAMSAAWDPTGKRLHFLGEDHGCPGGFSRHIYYDEATNGWTNLGSVNGFGGCHGWDHVTIDPKNRKLYFSPYGGLNISTYNLATDGPWVSLGTAPATGIVGITNGFSWFEGAMTGAGSSGAYIVYNDYASNGEVLLYDPNTAQWFDDIKGFGGTSTYHGFCEYSKVHNVALLGGGNANDKKTWRLNSNRTMTAMPDAPVGLGIQHANVVVDPVTGNFLAMGFGQLWELDPTGVGHWTLQTGTRVPPTVLGNPGYPQTVSMISASLSNHSADLYVSCQGANCVAYLYKHAGLFDTLPITQIQLVAQSTTIEQYLSTGISVITTYQGGGKDTTNPSCASLDTNILGITLESDVVTGKNIGTGRIAVYKRGATDTLDITVVPSTATIDSVRINLNTLGILSGDVYPLHATGYFHKNAQTFSRNLDTAAQWSSLQTGVATVAAGKVTGTGAGGPVGIVAKQGNVSDTAFLTVWPKPAFIKRINFQVSSTPWSYGWLADYGQTFTSTLGYGWSNSNGITTRDDRMGTNFLLKSIVSPPAGTTYKIDAPDGDYIVKVAVGDNQYGSTDTVRFGSNIVLTHSGQSNGIGIDTVTVTGGQGAVFTVTGSINYIVMISKEGIDINLVADDGGTAKPLKVEAVARVWGGMELAVTPNPIHGQANIRIKGQAISSVKIFDLRGRSVADLTSNSHPRSALEYVWETRNIPSGIYIVKISAGRRTFSKRLVVQK